MKNKRNLSKKNLFAVMTERYKENKADSIARRGYEFDWYSVFRVIWASYLTVMLAGISVYLITMNLIPITAVWYASAIGVTKGIDTLTMVSLYYVPFLFICGLLFVLECTFLKNFTKWMWKRNHRFCIRHYQRELAAQDSRN